MKQVGAVFGINVYADEAVKGDLALAYVKPLCREICADPDLICIADGHGSVMQIETQVAIEKGWRRVDNCRFRKHYRCKFEGRFKGETK